MANRAQNISAAWRTRAPWLARWAMYQLVNRTDTWGRYYPEARRAKDDQGHLRYAGLAPAKHRQGRRTLTESLLQRHFEGEKPEHLLGLQSVSPGGTSRWLGIDVHRGPANSADANFKAARHWFDQLVASGMFPVLMDSNGRGGYHLLLVFAEPVAAERVAAFGRELVSDAASLGLNEPPKLFPDDKATAGGRGNWLRLPGRHYATDHWTRVWNGRNWLDGADAVEALLHAHGDPVRLIHQRHAAGATDVFGSPVPTTRAGSAAGSTDRAIAPPYAAPPAASASSPPDVVDARTLADREKALGHLREIDPQRFGAYFEWLRLGMALHSIDKSNAMLAAWTAWSRRTPHTAEGRCQQHWNTFGDGSDRVEAMTQLEEWAAEDRASRLAAKNSGPLVGGGTDAGPNGSAYGGAGTTTQALADSATDVTFFTTDPDLREVVETWPQLSHALRSAILGIARAAE